MKGCIGGRERGRGERGEGRERGGTGGGRARERGGREREGGEANRTRKLYFTRIVL